MSTAYVLYNNMAGDTNTLESVKLLEINSNDKMKYIDVTEVSDYRIFLTGLEKDDYIILAGGDGTLNWFINRTDGIEIHNEILYFPNGTGNDFANDLGHTKECTPFSITEHLKNLPAVVVKGKKYRFINGVGYGIDGYCCEVGDKLKKIPGKKVNYTLIAIKGLLFHYKPTTAKVTVDGKTHIYNKVWIAPTMNGRYYGGGMMPTPNQKRNSGTLSTMIFHNSGKLKTLMIFPSLFKGKHLKYTKCVEILEGKEITVEFDRPTALQIDGETILNVSSYTAFNELFVRENQYDYTETRLQLTR
ncbi:MAG: diacylglycerol kinase family protein [Clostridia bacterium]|nr:diacylglycerol kinase family protein [Clostridia bacterium]